MGTGLSTGSCPAQVLGTTSWRRAAPCSFNANRWRRILDVIALFDFTNCLRCLHPHALLRRSLLLPESA